MQFLAYIPDESMTTVPFEIITIDVQDGVLAFKRNAKANPDLLILSYNRSTEALFKSEQAKAKSKDAVEKANEAETNSRKSPHGIQTSKNGSRKRRRKSGHGTCERGGTSGQPRGGNAGAGVRRRRERPSDPRRNLGACRSSRK